ncbi:MAG: hypothetical protein A2148_01210 [Chloroflexi bacterium RBG_16_68_14]|nr:MAG: hypothetical protein A2148_01210 [Chloroflexi bacterium RBG_16_68_14]
MRLALLLFALAVVVLGAPAPVAEGATVTVNVGDTWYCDSTHNIGLGGTPCDTSIAVGDTVQWTWVGALSHTVSECGTNWSKLSVSQCVGADWESALQSAGTFSRTFNAAGTFYYLCEVHPSQMRGRIIVGSVGGLAGAPEVAGAPLRDADGSGGNAAVLLGVTAAVTAVAVTAAGAAWYARRRWLR